MNVNVNFKNVIKYINDFINGLSFQTKGFMMMTVERFDDMTRDYIPRNADPPRDRGRIASGTLQNGFYSDISANMYMVESIVGYVAYDTYKDQMYAERVHTHPDWKHPKRYPGHKPVYNFLQHSLNVNRKRIFDLWVSQFKAYINYHSVR